MKREARSVISDSESGTSQDWIQKHFVNKEIKQEHTMQHLAERERVAIINRLVAFAGIMKIPTWKTYRQLSRTPIDARAKIFAVGIGTENPIVFYLDARHWGNIRTTHLETAPISGLDNHAGLAAILELEKIIAPVPDVQASLYGKYMLAKADGTPINPNAKYFVLRYDREAKDGSASRDALSLYASLVEEATPKLAEGLLADIAQESSRQIFQTLSEENYFEES
jgi:hypothetical protein